MLITCINKKCEYKWDYRGKSKSYICCPKCSYRFKINRGIDEYPPKIPQEHNIIDNIVHNIPLNIVQKDNIIDNITTIKTHNNLADFNMVILKQNLKENKPFGYGVEITEIKKEIPFIIIPY